MSFRRNNWLDDASWLVSGVLVKKFIFKFWEPNFMWPLHSKFRLDLHHEIDFMKICYLRIPLFSF